MQPLRLRIKTWALIEQEAPKTIAKDKLHTKYLFYVEKNHIKNPVIVTEVRKQQNDAKQ